MIIIIRHQNTRIRYVSPYCKFDMLCLKCRSTMKIIAFITDFQAVDCIIDHLKLTFVAEKPPPSRVLTEVALMAAEQRMEYFL